MTSSLTEPCRLTLCGPDRTVEVAVPAHLPLADLMPALLAQLGDHLADTGLEHGGWALQLIGGPPLDEDRSLAAQGLRDGDLVSLRPRADQLPVADFDDLVDGVAAGIARQPHRWRPDLTHRLLLGLTAVALCAAVGVLAHAGPGPLTALTAAGAGLVLLAGAVVLTRALGDAPGAGLAGLAAVACGAVAGAATPAVAAGGPGYRLLAGGLIGAGFAVAALLARVGWQPAFAGAAVAGLYAALSGVALGPGGTTRAGAAAIVLAVALPLAAVLPALASRLAGLRLPPLPNSLAELQADLDPEPGDAVFARTARADRHLTGLYWGLGATCGAALAVLALVPGWPARLMTCSAVALLALHARVPFGAWQRLAAAAPAALGAALLVGSLAASGGAVGRIGGCALALAAAGALYGASRSLPGARLVPHWGRAADLGHSLTALVLLPLAIWVLDGYARAYSWLGG